MLMWLIMAFLGLFLWELNGLWEWSPPRGLEANLSGWQERNWPPAERFIWPVEAADPEIESKFLQLRRMLLRTHKPLYLVLKIKLIGQPQNINYITSLLRRFPALAVDFYSPAGNPEQH